MKNIRQYVIDTSLKSGIIIIKIISRRCFKKNNMKKLSLILAVLFSLTSLYSCVEEKEKEIKKARVIYN